MHARQERWPRTSPASRRYAISEPRIAAIAPVWTGDPIVAAGQRRDHQTGNDRRNQAAGRRRARGNAERQRQRQRHRRHGQPGHQVLVPALCPLYPLNSFLSCCRNAFPIFISPFFAHSPVHSKAGRPTENVSTLLCGVQAYSNNTIWKTIQQMEKWRKNRKLCKLLNILRGYYADLTMRKFDGRTGVAKFRQTAYNLRHEHGSMKGNEKLCMTI